MRTTALEKLQSHALSLCAGVASFVLTLLAFVLLQDLDDQIIASTGLSLLAIMVVWVALDKPNSDHARAVSALIERLLAVRTGDLASPAPVALRRNLPELASAVDGLFEQVRTNIENVNAMALYDPVTSLPNRVHFRREAERILKSRKGGERVGLLFVDLDGFKEVNDNLGHAQGDQVLTMVANRLRVVVKAETPAGVRAQPILARLAGDEFTLMFPAMASADEAARIARRAVEALSEPMRAGGQNIHMGASIGVSMCPAHGVDLTSLMKAADIAMYHAKASGRSQVAVYDSKMAAAFEEKNRTEKALREALSRDEFVLAFQPMICTRTGAVVAGEALLRWRRPHRGLQQPDSFIGIAEESSLIVDIGDWVADGVAKALSRWQAAGMTQRLSFNVSPRQLERPDFLNRLRKAVADSGSSPSLVELEFTETTAMRCSEAVLAEMTALRSEGMSIAIDDFGSGYCNLSRMKEMPIDRVKLDHALIEDIDRSDKSREIVAAIVHLVHGMGCEVVAEGVERKAQLDVLRAVGCDIVQGFVYAEPMNEDEFVEWVRRSGEERPYARSA